LIPPIIKHIELVVKWAVDNVSDRFIINALKALSK